MGLLAVKGLGADTQARIVALRRRQPYVSLRDFLQRVHPAEDEARALINCGALDAFIPTDGNRSSLL